MLKIHGVPFSAHTRKVIIAALEKGIPYELVPVIPLTPPPGWTDLSALGLIPAIEDGGFTLADSSVICQYLERAYPGPSLYPGDARQFARVLWIEEFVDGGLAPHVLRGMEWYRGRLIAYSLGNFAGYKVFSLGGPLSTSGILRITLRGDGKFETGRLVATHLAGSGLPAIDPSEAAHGLVRTLSREDFGARAVKVSADGILSR